MGNDIEFKVLSQFENVQVKVKEYQYFSEMIFILLFIIQVGPFRWSPSQCLVNTFICKTSGCCHVHTCNNYINWNHDILHFSDFLLTYFNYFDNYIKKVTNVITYQQQTVSLFNSQVIDLKYSVKVKTPVIQLNTFQIKTLIWYKLIKAIVIKTTKYGKGHYLMRN